MAEQSWTDDPITAGSNRIRKKTIHFTELQDAINAWETAYSIENTNFTDSPAAGVKINTTAIKEMQDALDDLDILVSGGGFSWTEASTPKTIKPAHINELRDNMNIMQNDYCYQCDSCDTDTGCNLCDGAGCYVVLDECTSCDGSNYGYVGCSTCHGRCYSESCKYDVCTCNFDCYAGYSACTCDPACYNDECTSCDNACHEDICANCDNSTYRYPWT